MEEQYASNINASHWFGYQRQRLRQATRTGTHAAEIGE